MKNQRAYSVLEIKAVNEEKRIIRGIATTPEVDRAGDIVESLGVRFQNPLPLLWQHKHDAPVGTVVFDKPTADGISFEASLPTIAEEGALRDRIEEAWQSVKAKLVRGVSIGFRPIEYSFMDTGGIRFSQSEVYELSLVTIPANQSATIQTIKSFDDQYRAAHGRDRRGVIRLDESPPGESGTKQQPANGGFFYSRDVEKGMNIQEQIKGFKVKRDQLVARRKELMEAAAEKGETLAPDAAEEYDAAGDEIKAVEDHIKRLEDLERQNVEKATPVTDVTNGSNGGTMVEVKRFDAVAKAPLLKDGLAMAQVVKFLGKARGSRYEALELAKQHQGTDPRVVNVLKAAVAAGNTSNSTWAGALVGDESSVYADFVEFLRPQTIVGRFGAGNIPALRRVPFRVPLVGQTSGGAGYWVGEGQAKPLTKFDFNRTTLEPLKVANIAVLTEEVLRDSSPSADVLVRDGLVEALRERMDLDFIDPTKAATTGISPASILNGIAAIHSSGADAAAVRKDVAALVAKYIGANNPPTAGVIIMDALTALAISMMMNELGTAREFPGITMNGGELLGFPVLVSQYVPRDSSGGILAMVNASDIYFADDGGFAVDMSREASLQMDSAPTHNSTTPTAAQLVSLWQTNSVGFRAERTLNWARRRTSAVAWVDNVNYQVS
ncbi:phage major capsid protein [Pandoraea sp. CB10b_02]|uniref:phage major capsid protein n=1 Tax=Pandoraea sp. CB10b_02 TaxID=2014535 RepID=UPI00257B19D9|nr:phage major capsid protein [Pandoraea sp. CB10b_02]